MPHSTRSRREQELAWWRQRQWRQQGQWLWQLPYRRQQQLYLFDGPFEPEDL